MANSFGTTCKALWKFESGDLTTDSHGSNTLTDVNTVQEDAVNFKEGACSAKFEVANGEYFSVADSSFPVGFPLKDGDTVKKFSACFWYKATSFPGAGQGLIGKWTGVAAKRSYFIGNWSTGALYVYWGTSASSFDALNTGFTMVTGRWYHIGLAIDGVAKTCYLRVWDDTAGTTVVNINLAPTAPLYISDAIFTVGSTGDPAPIDGLMDEVVIFNEVIAASDIDLIRQGLYVAPPMSVIATGGADLSGSTTVTHIRPARLDLVATGGFELSSNNTITFYSLLVYEIISSGGYSVTSDSTVAFSYEDKYSLESTDGFVLGGEETEVVFGSNRYLLESSGGIELSSDLLAVEFSIPIAYEVEATGGVKLYSTGQVTSSSDIKHYDVTASGGFSLSTDQDYQATTPTIYTLTSRGGLGLSGDTTVDLITPDQYSLTATEGAYFSGDTSPVFSVPSKAYDLAAAGGFAVQGDSAAAFIHPYILQVIASGGLLLGADSSIEEIEDEYHTWSIMGDEFSASLYSGWRFNSYAILQGQSYAAGEDGIYLIGDEYDAGEDVHAGIRIGPTNMGVHNPKRLRSVKVNDPDAIVKVSNGVDDSSAAHSDFKATMGREVQGDELTIDITDFKKVSHIEIIPMILNRR